MIKKISKDEADYRVLSDDKRCRDCKMFQRPDGCTLVHGVISPVGTCKYWERKAKLPVGD